MRETAVCIHVLRVIPTATGLWCNRCALPSAITVEILLTIGHRHTAYGHATACTDCGQINP